MRSKRSLKGLSDADVGALQRLVDGQVDENLGMPMVYTIVAAVQEWLRDKVRTVAFCCAAYRSCQHIPVTLDVPGHAAYER